ncbi:MAG: hypothetical protein K8F91_00940 [Candidatus Obscuribacterales bacterium]|nr:hypothetical protein [Candidatus Obscuribacterales bacterium]
MKLKWYVDSPGNRGKCNEVIEDHTRALKKALGLPVPEVIEEKNIFMPPVWTLALVALMAYGTFQKYDEFQIYKAKKAEREQQQEQLRIAAEQDRQRQQKAYEKQIRDQQQRYEEQIRQYKENERRKIDNNNYTPKPKPYIPYKPQNQFAPLLTPQTSTPQGSFNKPSYQPDSRLLIERKKPATSDPYYKPSK